MGLHRGDLLGQIAEQVGDLESAGLAALTLVEELPERLSDEELCSHLQYADALLEKTQNADPSPPREKLFPELCTSHSVA